MVPTCILVIHRPVFFLALQLLFLGGGGGGVQLSGFIMAYSCICEPHGVKLKSILFFWFLLSFPIHSDTGVSFSYLKMMKKLLG